MTIDIERVDHIGIRVVELERALSFYQVLGFELFHDDTNDAVVIIRNSHDVEINLIYNAMTTMAATTSSWMSKTNILAIPTLRCVSAQ